MSKKKNIYNKEIMTQSYNKNLPKKVKSIYKRHFNEIGYKTAKPYKIYHENHLTESQANFLLKRELLDDYFSGNLTKKQFNKRLKALEK